MITKIRRGGVNGMKKTPLYQAHDELGGKIIDFGGWALPVQYSGVVDEHDCVRNRAGLFDVSHMGEIIVRGPEASQYIQKIITNDISQIKDSQIAYTPMCYDHGGVIDDLLVYKYDENKYLLVVNAANTEKDYQWMQENLKEKAEIENISDKMAQIAIQGPKSESILQKLTDTPLDTLSFYTFQDNVDLEGIKALVSRTGYTGEDGFEVYVSSTEALDLWRKLLNAGKKEGMVPAGLGARDILRFEAALPLYGQEITQDISPLEARLGIFVKLNKDKFIGKEALLKQKEQGLERKLVGIEMIDRGIPRHNYKVRFNNKDIGFITTGSYSPTLDKNIGLALIEEKHAEIGEKVDVVIREKPMKATIIKLPFYKKKYKK